MPPSSVQGKFTSVHDPGVAHATALSKPKIFLPISILKNPISPQYAPQPRHIPPRSHWESSQSPCIFPQRVKRCRMSCKCWISCTWYRCGDKILPSTRPNRQCSCRAGRCRRARNMIPGWASTRPCGSLRGSFRLPWLHSSKCIEWRGWCHPHCPCVRFWCRLPRTRAHREPSKICHIGYSQQVEKGREGRRNDARVRIFIAVRSGIVWFMRIVAGLQWCCLLC